LIDEDSELIVVGALKQTMDSVGINMTLEKTETEKMLVKLFDYSINFDQALGEPRLRKDSPEEFQDPKGPAAVGF
jgi:hypothetical protein